MTLRDGRAVLLRHADRDDAARMHAYVCALGRSTEMILTHEGDEPTMERIHSLLSQIPTGRYGLLLALEPESGEIVGGVSCRVGARSKRAHCAELGMGVLPSHRRVGLGTLLLKRAVREMRRREGITRLELTTLARNTHARRMYKRIGFVEEGVKRCSLRQPDGRYDDEVMMGMLLGDHDAETGDVL